MSGPDEPSHDRRQRPADDRYSSPPPSDAAPSPPAACPVCGGKLIEIRGKLQCLDCHTISETCCEGGPT